MSHSRESCQVEEETKWQPQWRISKMEIDSVPRQLFPIGNLKHFLTSDASSSSMTLSLAVPLLLASASFGVQGGRAENCPSPRIPDRKVSDARFPKHGCANEDSPHGSRAPVWLYGGLRSGCMECAAAGGCLVPRALSPNCVHTPQTGYDNLL